MCLGRLDNDFLFQNSSLMDKTNPAAFFQLSFKRPGHRRLLTMDTPDDTFNYRAHQQVWDPVKVDSFGRTREACSRCRIKRNKCDGQQPCGRCQRLRAECIYATQQQGVVDVLNDVSVLQQTLKHLSIELAYYRRQQRKIIKPATNATSSADESVETEQEHNVTSASENQREDYLWAIKTASGFQIRFKNPNQFYELLSQIERRSPVDHSLHSPSRPVGTRAMMFITSAQWKRWNEARFFQIQKYMASLPTSSPPSLPLDVIPFNVNLEQTEPLLSFVILQTFDCFCRTAGLQFRVISERLRECDKKQEKSPHCLTLRYAFGAMAAGHTLVYHNNQSDLHSYTDFERESKGKKIAAEWFEKARQLLIEQIFGSEQTDLCLHTVDALFAMSWYCFYREGQIKSAALYLGIAIEVATQCNYHNALRNSKNIVADPEELAKAITWNMLACTDKTFASYFQLPAHLTTHDMHLDPHDISVDIRPDMSEDEIETFNEFIQITKNSAICHDFLDAWWGENSPPPSKKLLDEFLAAFERWSAQLPENFRLSSLTCSYRSRRSFLTAVTIQLHHHALLTQLYLPFLPFVLPKPSSLSPGLAQRAERACLKAVVMSLKLVSTYFRAGGCVLPTYLQLVTEANMRLIRSKDEEIARIARAYTARVLRIIQGTKEYTLKDWYVLTSVKFLTEFMENKGIELDADKVLSIEEYFTPVKMAGVGW